MGIKLNTSIPATVRAFELRSMLEKDAVWRDAVRHRVSFDIEMDGLYAFPTFSYLQKEFLPFVWDFFSSFNVTQWTNRHDCNKKTHLLISLAHMGFARSRQETSADGIAFWDFHYMTDHGVGHSIARTYAPEKGFIYIDPTKQEIVKLTKTEEASSWLEHM